MTSIYLNYIKGNAELFLKIFVFRLYTIWGDFNGKKGMFEIILSVVFLR